ncbi:MAG: SDR family NAD(P)-dependent oxidoreductase [Mycobacteriaceae bacterium]
MSNGYAGKVAVVTGAGSGIGRALARELVARGALVALSDVDPVGLARTVELCGGADPVSKARPRLHATLLDVTQREQVLAHADAVAAYFGVVNLVFNNAGVSFSGDVLATGRKDAERVLEVDFWGVFNGTTVFLPHLIASGDGHVVNVSSVFGLLGVPSQSAYNAAKFAVRGFTESLRTEMLAGGHPVRVSCVHPGGVRTNIVRNGTAAAGVDNEAIATQFDAKLARTTPEQAARVILHGVEKGRARILVGADAKLLDAWVRVTGSGYQAVVARVARRIMPPGAHG